VAWLRLDRPDKRNAVDRPLRNALLAAGPTIRMGHIKQQLNRSLESTMDLTFREEVTLLGLGGGADSEEAMRAYAERREPRFQGR
jgi:2-(1,2-epoxy-1,2-dihydrophenyl)acetyl-CoA isomerase